MENNVKAQGLSLNMIIVAALVLIVLVIVAVIFRTQILHYAKGYRNIGDQAIAGANGTMCSSFFSTDRYCSDQRDCGDDQRIPEPPGGKWSDCKEPTKHCCERVSQAAEEKK